jgi:hypothetical protein
VVVKRKRIYANCYAIIYFYSSASQKYSSLLYSFSSATIRAHTHIYFHTTKASSWAVKEHKKPFASCEKRIKGKIHFPPLFHTIPL